MLKNMLIIPVLIISLSACDSNNYNDYKMNTSSKESIEISISEMSKNLSIDEKIAFDKAIDNAMKLAKERASQAMRRDFFLDKIKGEAFFSEKMINKYMLESVSEKLNNKTALHIVKEFS